MTSSRNFIAARLTLRPARGLVLLVPVLCSAGTLTPRQALDRYLAADDRPACSNSVFAVQVDASLPALKKRGSMTGFKWIVQPGKTAYRGLHFTGDNLVEVQVIARFLAHDTNPSEQTGNTSLTHRNYVFEFGKVSDYNGLAAYVFLLKPRHKGRGLFRGELWLDPQTALPLRLWGDFVKSPSILIRSIRFVQDYQSVDGCAEPLRLLLAVRTRIAGTAEVIVWVHPVPEPATTGTDSMCRDSISTCR